MPVRVLASIVRPRQNWGLSSPHGAGMCCVWGRDGLRVSCPPSYPQLQASRRRPPSSCLAAGLLQSGPAPRVRAPWHRQPACTLGHSGATARGPGAGTRLRPGFTPRRSREPARAPGLFPVYLSALLREQSSMLGFSFPSESRFLLASGKLHWFSNQMRRPESWCWTPVPGRLTRGWDFPPRKDW